MYKDEEKPLKVAIFGGSFNPPHYGHVAIVRWLLNQRLVDQVWVVPCFIHPYGKDLAPFEARITMCRFAFLGLGSQVEVLDVEKNFNDVSYTLKTIEYLMDRYHNRRFFLVVGEDVDREKDGWRDFAKIQELVSIIKLPRGEGSPIPNLSSTEIRKKISLGQSIKDLIPREVAVHIVTQGLYR